MEFEGSLPHLQVPVTCPYPEPVKSIPSPPHLTHFIKIHLNIIKICITDQNVQTFNSLQAKNHDRYN